MVDKKSVTLAEIHADYAKVVGHEPLTNDEKKQAFLDAVLESKQVEPFAIFSSLLGRASSLERLVTDFLAEWLDHDD